MTKIGTLKMEGKDKLTGTYFLDRAGMPWRVRGVAIFTPGTRRDLQNMGPSHYIVPHGWRWMGQMGAEPRTDKFIKKQKVSKRRAEQIRKYLKQECRRTGPLRSGMTERDRNVPDQYDARRILGITK